MAGAALILTLWMTVLVGGALAAPAPELAQVATPTPFRFLTPTPFAPSGTTSTTTTTTTQRPPNAGGFPLELAFPILAGGLVAIGGGSLVLRRKTTR
jgi:hypothetical protein